MKIALFEASQPVCDLTQKAVDIEGLEWTVFNCITEQTNKQLMEQRFDAIITSKQFSLENVSNIIQVAQRSHFNKETPIFLFTDDHSRECMDSAFDMGITDIFYIQELPALADVLTKINQFSRCVENAHVLLVEDNKTVCRMFAQVLDNLNCIVHVTANCELAIKILDEHPIELVITDLNLEDGGQGQRIIRSMRHYKKVVQNKIPIMVMSACDTSQSQTGLFFLGIDDYMVKPVLPMQFSLRVVNLIKKFRIFQQSEQQATELKETAYYDKLTRVYNRHGFDDIASFCVANCQRQIASAIGIMYIDLDNFKIVNDTHGHDAGDAVLVKITEILKIELRDQDIIARWGGDEFVVLLNQCDIRFIKSICRRIEKTISQHNKTLFGVSCSIGLAFGEPKVVDDVYDLITLADNDMYTKKRAHKLQE